MNYQELIRALFVNGVKDSNSEEFYHQVLKCMARTENIPEAILEVLSFHHDYMIRYHVAQNSRTNSKILNHLASDLTVSVRQAVASNVNTPSEALQGLSKDPNYWVRCTTANNVQTAPETLLEMCLSLGLNDEILEDILISNSNCPALGIKYIFGLRICKKYNNS